MTLQLCIKWLNMYTVSYTVYIGYFNRFLLLWHCPCWHCPAEIVMEFLGKVVILMAAYVSPKFQHKPPHHGTFTYMQITHAVDTDAPPCHHRGWFLRFSLVTVWMGFFILGTSFGPSQIPLGPENSAVFLCKINKCLLPFMIQLQVSFIDAAEDCVEWQWFSKVLPNSCGDVHHGSIAVSQTIPPEGSMVMRIQQRFPPLAFTHQDFPWHPESFHNMMNCWWWKTKIMCNIELRNTVFKLTEISLTKFGTKWWTKTHPCLLWWIFLLYLILITSPVTS